MQQYNYLCLTNFILYYYKMTTLLCKLYLLIFICYTLKIKIKVDLQMETPKNYDKKSSTNYTSPIGLLKNYNSIQKPNNNTSYQQQFYKIKAQRLQAELQQFKQQNNLLKIKITDISAVCQTLKEKIFVLQNNLDRTQRSYTNRSIPSFVSDSGYPSGNNSGRQSPSKEAKYLGLSSLNEKTERSVYNSEIQRLAKQNRILKNQHQLQMSKLRDENKKLTRRILQLENNTGRKGDPQTEIYDKNYRQKQDDRLSKLQKINNQLRKQSEQGEKQRKKLQQKLKLSQQSYRQLKIQHQQTNAIFWQKGKKNNSQDIKGFAQLKQKQYEQQIRSLESQIQLLKERSQPVSQSQLRQIKNEQNQRSNNTNLNNISVNTKQQKQIEILKRKMAIHEQALLDKDEQIKGILLKLKPLIEKQKNNRNQVQEQGGDSKRASLSILQVFLKKYKINSF